MKRTKYVPNHITLPWAEGTTQEKLDRLLAEFHHKEGDTLLARHNVAICCKVHPHLRVFSFSVAARQLGATVPGTFLYASALGHADRVLDYINELVHYGATMALLEGDIPPEVFEVITKSATIPIIHTSVLEPLMKICPKSPVILCKVLLYKATKMIELEE